MNKKGFTLIELLAIIVILAIIAVITVPIVLNIIDNSRKNTVFLSAHGYLDALEQFLISNEVESNKYYLDEAGNLKTKDGSLSYYIDFMGTVPSGNLTIDNNGKVNGCLSIYDYKVVVENDVVLDDVVKDDCREYYTITFNTNGGNEVESIVVREKEKIDYPKNVTKSLDGILYTFDKWITVDGENAPMIMPSDDVTFYAEYQDLGSLFKNGFITSTLNGNDKTLVKAIKQIENIDDVPIEYKTSTYNMSRNSIPIYMWYDMTDDVNTIYWYSYDKTPGFVSNSSLASLFNGWTNLENIDGLANWDVSNVTSLASLFASTKSLSNVDALSNWDTSSVTDFQYLFSQSSITNINGVSNWNTSNLRSLYWTFNQSSIESVEPLRNWDISKVESTYCTFCHCKGLTDISPLANWDTSSIWRMSQMFYGASNIKDASMLHWNTKSVTNYSIIFYYSGVPSSKYPTFYVKLEDRNNLSDTTKNVVIDGKWSQGGFTPGKWNEDRTEFTPGTWNEDGTFTPSE